jgi:hypothetical protein
MIDLDDIAVIVIKYYTVMAAQYTKSYLSTFGQHVTKMAFDITCHRF